MYSNPRSLSKPRVRFRTIAPSLADTRTMSSSWSCRLPVATAIRSPEGDGSIDSAFVYWVSLGVRREVAPVVGRPFLVAERLEAVLQVPVELLIELLGLHLERLLVGALAAADRALAQREQELPDALLARPRLDELEGRVPQVVDEARVAEVAVPLKLAHLRHDVGDGGVAHRHQVERFPARRARTRTGPRRSTRGCRAGAATGE